MCIRDRVGKIRYLNGKFKGGKKMNVTEEKIQSCQIRDENAGVTRKRGNL